LIAVLVVKPLYHLSHINFTIRGKPKGRINLK
jgi:hypothetical protein